MSAKRPSIAEAMREAAGAVRAVGPVPVPPPAPATPQLPGLPEVPPRVAPSRQNTKAITAHFPPQVRYQLKLMAAEQSRTMEDLVAEALNRLFAAYNKPEIAPSTRGDTL